jgi:hypothetical protein
MALFRVCLQMRTVNDTGEDIMVVVEATLPISAVLVRQRRAQAGALEQSLSTQIQACSARHPKHPRPAQYQESRTTVKSPPT